MADSPATDVREQNASVEVPPSRQLPILGACGCGSSCGCGCQSGGPCQCGG
ncbi:hypothetical protein [Streptomyces sp. NPDC127084]|uniref:hypothetical protein n=1 Tax=Streptomyces sp. NPDC127084 TaxID=3347133 RepID=UPI00365D0B0E